MGRLDGKVALITGVGGGMGRAAALPLLGRGRSGDRLRHGRRDRGRDRAARP